MAREKDPKAGFRSAKGPHHPRLRRIIRDRIAAREAEQGWGAEEFGLLHYSGCWFGTEAEAVEHFKKLVAAHDAGQPEEYLVRRRVRRL